jgi:hypothetical protein
MDGKCRPINVVKVWADMLPVLIKSNFQGRPYST